MIKKIGFAVAVTAVLLLSGCASHGLNSVQNQEMNFYKTHGLEVKEKNPDAAAVLGILPGGGSFYAGEPAFGIVNLLMWPLSILWDPFSGYYASEEKNYFATKMYVNRKKSSALSTLDTQLSIGIINQKDYVMKRAAVTNKYDSSYF